MKKPARPSDHDFWFIARIRKENSQKKLNKRQQKILSKVRLWEKFNGALDQKKWNF